MSNLTAARKMKVSDLCIITWLYLTSDEHKPATIILAMSMIVWRQNTHTTKAAQPVLILFKALVLSRLGYYCRETLAYLLKPVRSLWYKMSQDNIVQLLCCIVCQGGNLWHDGMDMVVGS